MPLNLPDTDTVSYFISAVDDLGLKGATLASGQSCTVVSSDPATVVLAADATPRPAPDGTPSVASGVASPASPIAAPNTPITITAAIIVTATGAAGVDDKGNPIVPATDTITVVPGLAHAEGILFGVPA
jgi:hypothetical protein